MPVCEQCGTDNPDIAKFCLACGSPIETQQPAEEERRPISAVFCDMVGSTSRAEQLDPEEVLALLEPYYTRLRAVLEQHGGTVEKFIGDAVVAVFGAPVAHEDDPERAVRAGLAILDQIRELNEEDASRELRVRIGITTGEAIVALGPRSQERGLAWGDTLNTAARLQGSAPVNGVIVDERTYRAAAAAIDFRELELIEAKGKAQPVPVWEVVGVKVAARGTVSDAPLVGRAGELGWLTRLWTDVAESGRPGVAVLVGEAGIGKSRLLTEAVRRAEGARVHWGRCLSYGEGITYWPVTWIVREAAGILGSDELETVSEKLGALLESLPTDDLDQLRTMAAALSNLVGAPTTPRGTFALEEISQPELHWGIRRTFELLAAERPLVLVFEDLHWAEPTLLELLVTLAEESAAPILVLASARPELAEQARPLLHEGERRVVLRLEALTEEESHSLASKLLAERGLDASAVEGLLANARGNPLFLHETARMLLDSGAEDVATLSVPNSLQALVGARLDSLAPLERRLAQHASVAGTVFWSGAAAHLSERRDDCDTLLEALDRREIVLEHDTSTIVDQREWEFRHIVIRDVAYGRLPRRRRVALHVRFADWLSALPGSEEEFVEILAHHLEQACLLARETRRTETPPLLDRAVATLALAGERAERHEGLREARRYYERALELVGDERPETAVELRLRRARTLVALGELSTALTELEEAAAAGGALGRRDLECEALIALANVAQKRGQAAEARRRLLAASAIAEELGSPQLTIRAAYELAELKGDLEGEVEPALGDLRRGLALAEAEGDLVLRIEGHLRLGMLLVTIARLSEADQHLTRCSVLAGETGSLRDEARAAFMLGVIRYYRGDLSEAERVLLQALTWLERAGDSYFRVQNLRLLALLSLARGDRVAAERRLNEALPLALETGGWLATDVYRWLTEALVQQGRLAEARTLAEFAVREAPEEDPYARAAALLATASVAAAEGQRAPALAAFEEASRLLAEQRLRLDLVEAQLSFARALVALGDTAGARAELARARSELATIDAPRLVAEVERELAALDGRYEPQTTTVPVPVPPGAGE